MIYFIDFFRTENDVVHRLSIEKGKGLGGQEMDLNSKEGQRKFLTMVYKDQPKQIIFDGLIGGAGRVKQDNLEYILKKLGIKISDSGELDYPVEINNPKIEFLASLIS